MKEIQCCFCGKTIPQSESNNPKPANTIPGARCCYECDKAIVEPLRRFRSADDNSEPVPGVSVLDPDNIPIDIDPYLSNLLGIRDNLAAGVKGIRAAQHIKPNNGLWYIETAADVDDMLTDVQSEITDICNKKIIAFLRAALRASKEVTT